MNLPRRFPLFPRMPRGFSFCLTGLGAVLLFTLPRPHRADADPAPTEPMERIQVGPGGTNFVGARTGRTFTPWGFNYDHDVAGTLLEDYWATNWTDVAGDFAEMKSLGANVARIHLQVGKFMRAPDQPSAEALERLAKLVSLAESNRLYLDLTGLGCYHKADIPPWYDAMSEEERWAVQSRFWEAVAATCRHSPAVFCYDLMNEPILPGSNPPETDWLARPLGDKHFVQRITLDLKGRTREAVARAWIDTLVSAIRRQDKEHLITVGVIPWAFVFPGAKPLFHHPDVGGRLDFVSVHFYPKTGEIPKALTALQAYEIGKPLVVEEMFPLSCGVKDLEAFIDGSRPYADGWIGFYWGRALEDYEKGPVDIGGALTREWLRLFRKKTGEILPANTD